MSLKLIIEELKYLCPDKKILQSSGYMKNQKELENSLNVWRKKLKINRNIKVNSQLSTPRLFDLFKHFWITFLLFGGGYMRLIESKKYEIRLHPKSANKGALIHELLHIKLKHEEKIRKKGFISYYFYLFKFEIEANKELTKYKNSLEMKRAKSIK